ncbi:methylamine utilization protein [Dyella sp.]|jgi:plastocyanin|uniref:methylamine utilization protein n=1 Tax=Dyella sp. TaxID=1869338 RepID=UPI002D778959|nr:methylamine utilization protein [Dyella sp.]HET6431293.1 methylamine utilization protein [Dyella sp.]
MIKLLSSRAALRMALALLPLSASATGARLDVQVRDTAGAPVRDAVVWLLPLDRPAPPASAGASAVLDQRNLSFTPQVLVVRTGATVSFPNSDNVRHQVYSFSPAKHFELKLYTGNHASTEQFDQPGIVTLGCNIHDWMLGYVVVVDTPWFAQSGDNGQLTLEDLPAGRYTLQLWQPRLAAGAPPVSETVSLGTTPLQRNYTLALVAPEQTNQPPPDLEMGLGARTQGSHEH